jgi:hypothetical protein
MQDRARNAARALSHLLIAVGGLTVAGGVAAQDGVGTAGQFGPAVIPQGDAAVGRDITSIDVIIGSSAGNPDSEAEAAEAVREALYDLIGREYRPDLVERTLAPLIENGVVGAARHRPAYDGALGTLAIEVTIQFAAEAVAEAKRRARDVSFPVLHEDDRSKLTLIASAGLGVYSDSNAWFGDPELFNANNPLAGELPGDSSVWLEGFAELGIGGITQLGSSDIYAFGAVSVLGSFSRGQDIFTDEGREFIDFERGYAGLLYANRDTGDSAKLTLGRQTWSLNDGFLISMIAGSSNAGERGGTYLGPRNATDFSAVFNGEFGKARVSLFYIDPNELEDLESDTTFAGANLGYQFTDSLSFDASVIVIPTSKSSYRTPGGETLAREGTLTYGVRGLYRPKAPDHLWIEAEGYLQTNNDYDMSAHAAYGTVGYILGSSDWSPSLSYRYATFSGDDPETDEFERFDSLMSTGLGIWLQGISFGKVYRNGNLNTHRVQGNISPKRGMNVTLTYHKLRADELNNLGGNPALSQLTSRDIGDEITGTLRWAINRELFLQVVASRAFPGDALEQIGATEPWTTLQSSLYLSF